jgi:hypothetical protein
MPRRLAERERHGGADHGAGTNPFHLMFFRTVHWVAHMILSIIVKLPYSQHPVLVYAQIPIGTLCSIPLGSKHLLLVRHRVMHRLFSLRLLKPQIAC